MFSPKISSGHVKCSFDKPAANFFIFGNRNAQLRNKIKDLFNWWKIILRINLLWTRGKKFGHTCWKFFAKWWKNLRSKTQTIPPGTKMLFWQTRWIFRRITQKLSPKILQQKLSQLIVPKVDCFFSNGFSGHLECCFENRVERFPQKSAVFPKSPKTNGTWIFFKTKNS